MRACLRGIPAVQAGTEVEPTILNNVDGEGQNDEVQGKKTTSQPSDAKVRSQSSFVHHRARASTGERISSFSERDLTQTLRLPHFSQMVWRVWNLSGLTWETNFLYS